MADLLAQRAQGIVYDARLAGAEEDQVARLRACAFENPGYGFVRQELEDRRLQPVPAGRDVIDLDISETFGTEPADVIRVVVDYLSR